MRKIVTHELHVFFICECASGSPITANSVEGVHISRVHVPGQNRCTFPPFGTKGTQIESHPVYIAYVSELWSTAV